MDHPTPSSRLVTATHCSHLRHKGMYVMAEYHSDYDDGGDGTAYWCTCTQKPIGPDGGIVSADTCKPGRECCG
jgi:hypothetical protein